MTSSVDLLALGRDYYLPVYRPRQMILERGRGSRLWDIEGREYVDLAGGIAVCGLGHCHPELTAALVEQAGKLWHTSNVFYSEPPVRLAEELVTASRFAEARVPVQFRRGGQRGRDQADPQVGDARRAARPSAASSSPSAAVSTAARWPRSPRPRSRNTRKATSRCRAGSATSTSTTSPSWKRRWPAATWPRCMLEPVQGEGGVMPAAPGFLQAVRALCDQHDALLVLDEIQCGMGRSGALFAHWQDGVVPDIVTLAKALGGGMPIGAMLAGPKVAEVMQFGAHGTTFGGNPLASAVARVALRTLASDDIAANVQRQAQAIRDGLDAINRDLDLFSEVRGRGLMLGAVLKPEYAGRAGEILDHAAANGLLLLQAGPDVLRFVPALNIGDEDVAEGLARLRTALEAFVAG